MEANRRVTIFFRSPIDYLRDGLSKPLGGAETAALRMKSALNCLGIRTDLVDREPIESSHSDVLIVKRFPLSVIHNRTRFRKVYFWPPDDTNHGTFKPLMDWKTLSRFNEEVDGVLAISNYQYSRLIAIGISKSKLIQTRYGVQVSSFPERAAIPAPVCIYTSSPRRGLHLLPAIWVRIQDRVKNSHLWIYSSMATYRKDDKPFESLYAELRSLPNVSYFGPVKQSKLALALSRARVFLYPNTFPETCSISTLEARASGCAIVTTASGALVESAVDNALIANEIPVDAYVKQIADASVLYLLDNDLWLKSARNNQLTSLRNDWQFVAREWIRDLNLASQTFH